MNAVGIDVSKGKSTVAVLRPFGEVAVSPFDVIHNDSDLKQLAELIKALPGESKVVMEYTGTYFEPIAQFLHNNGIFVSVVNALLVHDYGGNSLRKVKTDKKDALKLASYALDRWTELDEYIPADEQRKTLKLLNRQYNQSIKIQTMMKNNLISLTILFFPVSINSLHLPKDNLTVMRNGWIFLKHFPIGTVLPSCIYPYSKPNTKAGAARINTNTLSLKQRKYMLMPNLSLLFFL